MKIYISGKISGLHPEEAYDKFLLAENRLRMGGYEPVNPIKLNPTPGLSWEEYMLEDIKHLFKCESIVMLPCWTESKGARIEHTIAIEHGLKVIYFNTQFLNQLFLNHIDFRMKTERYDSVNVEAIIERFEIQEEEAFKLLHERKHYGLY